MKTRFLVVAGTIASALAIAGCKQEAKAPEPVRPVLSAVLQPAATEHLVPTVSRDPQFELFLSEPFPAFSPDPSFPRASPRV